MIRIILTFFLGMALIGFGPALLFGYLVEYGPVLEQILR